MTHHPYISIIMPIFNSEHTISASVDSVLTQSFTSWELILVDDGSTDASRRISEKLTESDSRIRVFTQKNSGPSSARNFGIEKSRGKYIAFLDADDIWGPNRLLDATYRFADAPETGVLFSRVRFVDAISGKPGTLTPHYAELDAVTLLAENPVCTTSNIICRRSVLEHVGRFKAGLDYAEDQDWLVRVALDGTYIIAGMNSEGLYYSSSATSLSSDLQQMRAGWLRMRSDARQNYPDKVGPIQRSASARFHRYLARRALRLRNPRQALKYIYIALRQDPFLILRQPRRTGLTLLGTFASLTKITKLQELAAK